MTGLSSEVLKNLVLAGVRATVCDNRPYPDAISETPSFFSPQQSEDDSIDCDDDKDGRATKRQKASMTVAEAMQKPIEELNPLLGKCDIILQDVATLSSEILGKYDIVVASRISPNEAIRIVNILRESPKKGKFFMGDSFGLYGVCCIDLGEGHTFRDDIGKTFTQPQSITPYVPIEKIFQVNLADAVNRFHKTPPPAWMRYRSILEYANQLAVWPQAESMKEFAEVVWGYVSESSPSLLNDPNSIFANKEALHEVAKLATAEVAPVCAVLGGIISNEVIKAISGKGAPANNTLLFDGLVCKAWSFLVQ
jgi:ubiquitin-like 1-activating enzyme E1 A